MIYKSYNLIKYLSSKVKISLIFSLALFLFISTPTLAQTKNKNLAKLLVLNYEDFGPQVIAYKLIGYEFYQWNHNGSSDPKEKDVIFVVVYRDIPLKKLNCFIQ